MMKITVWEKPNCVQCNQTKKEMDKRGIKYSVRRLDKSPKAIERFLEMGLTSAPIVETDDRRWSGFRIHAINGLAQHLRAERAHGINVPLEPLKHVADEVEEDE